MLNIDRSGRSSGGSIAAALILVLCVLVTACTADSGISLPVVHRHASQDGPGTLKGVYSESDLVVVVEIESATPGRHYFGPDPEDPTPDLIEDVSLQARVIEVYKGEARVGQELEVAWSAYVSTGKSEEERTARLSVGGVVLNEVEFEGRYLMFLEEFGEPWGTKPLIDEAGVIQLDQQGRASGQKSEAFHQMDGLSAAEIVDLVRR